MAQLELMSNGWKLILKEGEIEETCWKCKKEINIKEEFLFCPSSKKCFHKICDKDYLCKTMDPAHEHFSIIKVTKVTNET